MNEMAKWEKENPHVSYYEFDVKNIEKLNKRTDSWNENSRKVAARIFGDIENDKFDGSNYFYDYEKLELKKQLRS